MAKKISGLLAATQSNLTDLKITSQSNGMGGWVSRKVTNEQDLDLFTKNLKSPGKLIFVAPNGDDTDGTGTINNPFVSYNAALTYAQTLSPSESSPVAIIMTEGVYVQSTTMTIHPWVYLIGVGRPTINFSVADIIVPTSPFGTSGVAQFVVQGVNLYFSESQNIDFVAGGAAMWVNFIDCLPYKSPTKTVTFNNPNGGELSIYFDNNLNYSAVNASLPSNVLVDVEFNNVERVFINNSYFHNITCNNASFGSTYEISNTKIYGELSFTKTGVAASNYILTNNIIYQLAADGSLTINIDAVSYPTNGLTLANSAALDLLTDSNAINGNYTPTNYTPTDTSVKGHLEGIDTKLNGILKWNISGVGPLTMDVNNGYINKVGNPNVYVLPASFAVGDIFKVVARGAPWRVAQQSGQTIYLGSSQTTVGAGGYLESNSSNACVELIATTADTELVAIPTGSITVV